MKTQIKKTIRDTIKQKWPGAKVPDFNVEVPTVGEHGDYSTNATLVLGKQLKKKPMDVAKDFVGMLRGAFLPSADIFEKIEIKEPGFINFFLSREFLQKQIKEILDKKERYGQLNIGKQKKVQVEFISANPTGPLTLGNGRGGFLGDCLANVLNKAGYNTEREYYINNVGEQINDLGLSVLGESGSYRGDYLKKIAEKVKANNSEEAGQQASEIIMREMIKPVVEKKMKIKFDNYFSEKSLYDSGAVNSVIEKLKNNGLTHRKNGAIWFKSTKFGDNEDRVLVKKDKEKTYLASDIAYHLDKFERGFEKLINIWGADHHGYIERLRAGIQAFGYKSEQLEIIITQLVRLIEKGKEKKISKRAGSYITVEELIDDLDKYTKRAEGEEGPNGLDIARYFFLSYSPDTHMNFDLDLAREQSEKNPVYYIQYSYARMCSILREAPKHKLQIPNKSQITNSKLQKLTDMSELNLIKKLIQFSDIISDTAQDYQVQRLPRYAYELANSFNQFYRDCRVINEDKKELSSARLALVRAAKIILAETLGLMGISAPNKM